ncbi:MAG: diaminopimelate decarboxylase [Acidimicrobiales bacterium]
MTEPAARDVPAEGPVSWSLLPDSSAVTLDGHLSVGGIDFLELADQFGTPVFVYDEEHLRARAREAVAAFGPGVAYATKAFLCKAMAALALEEGMALDVSTGGELAVALAAGVPGERLVCHGNNKSAEELAAALGAGVGRIVVDSFDEIDRLRALCPGAAAGHRPQLLVRVTPGIEAHTHEYVRTGQEDTKFGFSLASGAAAEAVEALRSLEAFELVGVHAHIGSQIFETSAFVEEIAALAPFVAENRFSECCIGGGLGVAYVEGEQALSITEWARAAHAAAREAGLAADVRLTAEPGRAIVASAAVTLYRVGTIKRLAGLRCYVAVDGGMSDNPRPVLYGSGYEAFLPREPLAPRPQAAHLVGKHCESGDVIVDDARLPADVAVGDVVATPVTGAYGYSMASNYNRVLRPPVVFVSGARARVVVRRETIADLLALEA